MTITFNTPQEQSDFEDFCERLCEFIKEHSTMDSAEWATELLREMQERGLTFE